VRKERGEIEQESVSGEWGLEGGSFIRYQKKGGLKIYIIQKKQKRRKKEEGKRNGHDEEKKKALKSGGNEKKERNKEADFKRKRKSESPFSTISSGWGYGGQKSTREGLQSEQMLKGQENTQGRLLLLV